MLSLDELKAHLRIDHDAEDDLLLAYRDAAMQAVINYTGGTDTTAAPIKAAILLLVADLYLHREKNSDRVLHENPTYKALLDPYRQWELS